MDYTNLSDLSAIIVGLTAVLIYFGKIIADTKVEKFEKTDIIMSGLFFVLLLVLFPLALNVFFFQKGWVISFAPWIVIVFHLVLGGVYSKYVAFESIKKHELRGEFDKQFNDKIDEVKKQPVLGKIVKKQSVNIEKAYAAYGTFFRFLQNSTVLLIVSAAIFYSLAIIWIEGSVLSIVAVGILAFVNLSLLAIAYGTASAYYPPSKITFVDGKTLEGKALKFGEFIYIVKGDKKYFVNKDHVKIIEQDLMKKKEESHQ